MNKVYQVVEVITQYIDGFDGDHEWEEELNKGYYSTMENAQKRLDILTNEYWSSECDCCMRKFKINEIELDVE